MSASGTGSTGTPHAMNWVLFWILVSMGIVSVGLGVWGFQLDSPDESLESSFYRAVQLLTLESGYTERAAPLPLAVARWLAPISLLGGAIQFLRNLYERIRRQRVASAARDHVVIFGMGRTGRAFARAFLAKGTKQKVLGVDPAPDHEAEAMDVHPRFVLLRRDAREETMREEAGLARVREIVVATDADELNLEIADACLQHFALAGGPRVRRGAEVTLRVHLTDRTLLDALQRAAASDGLSAGGPGGGAGPRVRYINHYADLARRIVFLNPLEMACGVHGATDASVSIHLVLTGLDRLQTAMLLEVARVGHYSHDRKVHVHLVLPDSAGARESLLSSYPRLEKCIASLNLTEVPAGAGFVWSVARVVHVLPDNALVTVLPSELADHSLHGDVYRLRELVPGRHVQVLVPSLRNGSSDCSDVVVAAPSWVKKLHEGAGPALGGCVRIFDEKANLERCVVDATDGKDDELGKRIHDAWLRKQGVVIEGHKASAAAAQAAGSVEEAERCLAQADNLRKKPTHRPWEELTESQREQNHSQASHHAIKVRAAGLSADTLNEAAWGKLSAEVLEVLARMEHERWMAYHWLCGWIHADTRDDAARRHNNLVPYDQLDEETKGYDRDVVRKVISFRDQLIEELRASEGR